MAVSVNFHITSENVMETSTRYVKSGGKDVVVLRVKTGAEMVDLSFHSVSDAYDLLDAVNDAIDLMEA